MDVLGIEVEVEAKVFDLEDLWKQRQRALEREEKSMQDFEKMNVDEREALESIIDQALIKLREDKSWLPYSLEVKEGASIDVSLRFLFSDISMEIIKRRTQELKQLSEATESTRQMVEELESAQDAPSN